MKRGRPRTVKYEPTIYGINLRRLRDERNMGQEELADKIDYSQADVSRAETGETQEPSSPFLKRCAEALGVPLEAFWVGGPVSATQKEAMASLEQFLASDLAKDATEADKSILRALALVPFGTPDIRAWSLVFEGIRRGKKP